MDLLAALAVIGSRYPLHCFAALALLAAIVIVAAALS